jgi:integrase
VAADGISVLTFEQARAKALELSSAEGRPAGRLTVRRAIANYLDYLRAAGKQTHKAESSVVTHILPQLGDVEVASLTSAQLRRWLLALASRPARKRSKQGEQTFKNAPTSDEAVRQRRCTANRIFTTLKAALNYAYDEKLTPSNDAWGRRVKRFKGVDAARVRYLTIAEADRLLNACEPSFRLLVRAALETGMRYGELARLEISDFNPDAGTMTVRKSKTGRTRHVVLTPEGVEFFRQVCAGRAGLMFARSDGEPWGPSNQGRLMLEGSVRARIDPPINFHGLRHTWASHAVMNGVPLMIVAQNLGHRDTTMVQKHYAHLAPSYVTEAIRAGAPRFAAELPSNVKPLKVMSKNLHLHGREC